MKELELLESFTIEEFQKNFDNLMSRVENGESFIIKDGDNSYSIVEDTWRTAGTSQKVEKKIGDQLRQALVLQADNRRKKIHY